MTPSLILITVALGFGFAMVATIACCMTIVAVTAIVYGQNKTVEKALAAMRGVGREPLKIIAEMRHFIQHRPLLLLMAALTEADTPFSPCRW